MMKNEECAGRYCYLGVPPSFVVTEYDLEHVRRTLLDNRSDLSANQSMVRSIGQECHYVEKPQFRVRRAFVPSSLIIEIADSFLECAREIGWQLELALDDQELNAVIGLHADGYGSSVSELEADARPRVHFQ
jgi:hypothetical protein